MKSKNKCNSMTECFQWTIALAALAAMPLASKAAIALDTSFNPGPNGTVRTIAIQPSDGSIIIGGDFN